MKLSTLYRYEYGHGTIVTVDIQIINVYNLMSLLHVIGYFWILLD